MSIALLIAAAMAVDAAPAPLHFVSMERTDSRPVANKGNKPSAERMVAAFYANMNAGKFDQALAAVDQLDPPRDNPTGRAFVAVMRASALLGLKRDKEALRLIAEANELAPKESTMHSTLFLGALIADRVDVAADALDRLIERTPEAVAELDQELVWHFLRNEPKGEEKRNEDRRVALARQGFGGSTGDYFTKRAVEILVKRGDIAGARAMLRNIDEPQIVENFLIQKRYAALWPNFEASAGPRLEKVRASSVQSAEREYAEAPDNHEKLQLLANALRHAGRHDEAISLRTKLPTTLETMSTADEQMGWAVNNVALALHEVGRGDEADQLFAMLNDAPMEEEFWRVSMKINRLELLVSDGKFDRALPLVEPTAKARGSAYAEQLVRRLRYCTLSGLGRKEEAAKLLPDLLSHSDDAPGPTIDGLVCGGQLDEAEKVALSALKEDSFHEDFVRGLQERPLTSDDPSVWSKGWKELRRRPAIAQEFERLGRDMPEQFLPPPVTK